MWFLWVVFVGTLSMYVTLDAWKSAKTTIHLIRYRDKKGRYTNRSKKYYLIAGRSIPARGVDIWFGVSSSILATAIIYACYNYIIFFYSL